MDTATQKHGPGDGWAWVTHGHGQQATVGGEQGWVTDDRGEG